MPILLNCEVYYAKLGLKNPDRYDQKKPKWQVELRTTSKAKKAEWEKEGLKVTIVDPTDGEMYYKTTLRRTAVFPDGTPGTLVEVFDMRRTPIDPYTVGNGSIADVQFRHRKYTHNDETKTTPELVKLRVRLLKLYDGPAGEDFEDEDADTEYRMPEGASNDDLAF